MLRSHNFNYYRYKNHDFLGRKWGNEAVDQEIHSALNLKMSCYKIYNSSQVQLLKCELIIKLEKSKCCAESLQSTTGIRKATIQIRTNMITWLK